jgi:septal ring factor EnvC (AmiA/AmiB activator)
VRARFLALLPLAFVAAAPAAQGTVPAAIAQSQAEYEAAQAEARRLQTVADRATEELGRLRAEQRAAAGDIEATEARITLAGLRLRQAQLDVRAHRLALAEAQRPIAALLTGVAMMGERPPLLALIDAGSIDSLVEARILLDSTLPVIRARSAAYAARLASAERALASARIAQHELEASRAALHKSRARFAAIEQRLLGRSARAGGLAAEASDRVLATGEASERALGDYRVSGAIRALASAFASGPAIPPRPGSADGALFRAPFAYRLPGNAPVTQGMGDVDRSGIRARGVTLATTRGAALEVPGAGTVRFAGPFRGIDGVLIIDHGGGWTTMLVNVSTELRRGQRVAAGDPAGRALGPISVELYRNGKPYSPALIAGSSARLSKGRERG